MFGGRDRESKKERQREIWRETEGERRARRKREIMMERRGRDGES